MNKKHNVEFYDSEHNFVGSKHIDIIEINSTLWDSYDRSVNKPEWPDGSEYAVYMVHYEVAMHPKIKKTLWVPIADSSLKERATNKKIDTIIERRKNG